MMLLLGKPDAGTVAFHAAVLVILLVMLRPGSRANRGVVAVANALAEIAQTVA